MTTHPPSSHGHMINLASKHELALWCHIILPGCGITLVGPRQHPQYTHAHHGGEAVVAPTAQCNCVSEFDGAQTTKSNNIFKILNF